MHAQTAPAPLDTGLSQVAATGLGSTDIRITVAKIIRAALGLLGIVALVLVLYGGFVYMTAGGNEDRIAQGKKILVNAGIGLIIILSAFGIVSFVMNQLVAATTDTGAGGAGNGGGGDGGDGTGTFSDVFDVVALPQVGQICIRNINLAVTFNKEVDLATVDTNIVVQDTTANNAAVAGAWKYGSDKKTIIFTPEGTCAPSVGNDCLKASTPYSLVFTGAANIKTFDKTPELTLNCHFKAGCGPVAFTSGDGVDRLPPKVTITYPTNITVLEAGASVPVQMTYTDDNGVQQVKLSTVDGGNQNDIDTLTFAGCKKTDTVTIDWPSKTSDVGGHTLQAEAMDWAGQTGKDTQAVTLKPNHCFNGIVEANLGEEKAGPPECGGECGSCGGSSCTSGAQCASGDCASGVCTEVMQITSFSPASGAPGTFVTINGHYFGAKPGKIYFAVNANPSVANAADWKEALAVNCTGNVNNWSSGQVIAKVPEGITPYAAIKVESAAFIGADGKTKTNVDATTKHAELKPFELNNLVRPNLCSIAPGSDRAGAVVQLIGSGFGVINNAADGVMFGDLKAVIAAGADGTLAWAENRISAGVPAIDSGTVGVKVIKNKIESNSVRFLVESGQSADSPTISAISPAIAPAGQYLTITGKNFGTKIGTISFKTAPTGQATLGDFTFPQQCAATVWADKQIIVKFPRGQGSVGTKYIVQVKTADNQTSLFDQNHSLTLQSGDPTPGICAITPTSGPIPFPAGQSVRLFGDYFITAAQPNADVYFWDAGATNPDSIAGRVAVPAESIVEITANTATVVPPADTVTGPVSVYRPGDSQISNDVTFGAFDCRTDTTVCSATEHCCINGLEAGLCKSVSDLCSGESLSAGYVWRFATKDIPPVPHVVERCDVSVDVGDALPTPTPSVQWDGTDSNGDQHNVCKSALITVEFDSLLDQTTLTDKTVLVTSCDAIDGTTCTNPKPITLTQNSFALKAASASSNDVHQYLSLQGSGSWTPGTWYQVVLTDKIKSMTTVSGAAGLALATDKPCGTGTAYCFAFKAGDQDCHLKTVIVTPYRYFTEVLESPVRYHNVLGDGDPIDYRAAGLSDQRCIMMDVSLLPWQWESSEKNFAGIAGAPAGIKTNVSAKANTVGIGLKDPADGVDIKANVEITTDNGSAIKTGKSPLTIDLSNPSIIDYWPKCLEACTNASVGVRFNVSMSSRNLVDAVSHGSVHLYKCADANGNADENCQSKIDVGNSLDIFLTDDSGGTVLAIANSSETSQELAINSIYQVVLSAAHPDPVNAPAMLWARAKLIDPTTFGKPFNQQFTWRFRTKAERCTIDRADVRPKNFIAEVVNDKAIYSVQPYSAPDSCSKQGQKLNAWSVSWAWDSTDKKVADVTSFVTKGKNLSCTNSCIRKGSTVPSSASSVALAVCGNSIVEAGEDCDAPGKANGCSLNCRWLGNTDPKTCGNGTVENKLGEACDPKDINTGTGCTETCLRAGSGTKTASKDVSASICGNGFIGFGEDCDTGIPGDMKNNRSAFGCSASCLHLGTRLSTDWCARNRETLGGFIDSDYKLACARAYSQCGDGVQSPDEDPLCDIGGGKHASWCNDYCLNDNVTHGECKIGDEGCSATAQHTGSSLSFATPSVCGDGLDLAGKAGIGEDPFCEQDLTVLHAGLFDPWSLATGLGQGLVNQQTDPPSQQTTISAATSQSTRSNGLVKGEGKFTIMCGYRNDNDCSKVFGANYGVGDNSCCFVKPKVIGTFPSDGSSNVCRNTILEATFNGVIDENTLPGNVLIARAQSSPCTSDLIDMSDAMVPFAHGLLLGPSGTSWCAGLDQGQSSITIDGINPLISHLSVALTRPLATNTYYAVILKDGLKDARGVGIAATNGIFVSQFQTTEKICLVNAITVFPANWYFSIANSTTSLKAVARTGGVKGIPVQPIPGFYSWFFIWQPQANGIVDLQITTSSKNIITAKNVNGEVDIRATAIIQDNILTEKKGPIGNGSSHIIVNLCTNPWPPKEVMVDGKVTSTFPFRDAPDNASGFDSTAKAFNGSLIPPGTPVSPETGDGYFNLSTFYCADAGAPSTVDDLPYLRPTIQTTVANLDAGVGSCEITGASCQSNSDCGQYYTGGNLAFTASNNATGICGGRDAGDHYFFTSSNDTISCTVIDNCTGNADFNNWNAKNKYAPTCVAFATNLSKRTLTCYKYPPLKRFIFTNDTNSDAIGMEVFSNPQHLSASEWYGRDKTAGGQGFAGNPQNVRIAGYPAVSDGSNIYVDALNYSPNTKSLNSNIYLFSINQDAKEPTRAVFQQLMANLRLNTNLTYNDGFCGKTMDQPGSTVRCATDLDCSGGEVCVNQVAKLKRNYQRYYDLKNIEATLQSYAGSNGGVYPSVSTGSFLPGQSLSVWDWAGIASQLEAGLSSDQTLPKDPIDRLGVAGTCKDNPGKFCATNADCSSVVAGLSVDGICTLHDAATGWSIADRRFSFACASTSYAYRYTSTATSSFVLLNRFEDTGLVWANQTAFVNGFDYTHQDWLKGLSNPAKGICDGSPDVFTSNKSPCGDGQVGKGEECDPPGASSYDRSSCQANGSGLMFVKTCNDSCKWNTPTQASCVDAKKCGNGRIDSGETCDDGVQNGNWNKCTKDCQPPKPLSLGGAGYCGDKVKDTIASNNSKANYEVCDAGKTQSVCTNQEECTTVPVCVDKQVCPPKFCWVHGTMYGSPDSPCADVLACRGYLSGTEQPLQDWFSPGPSQVYLYPSYSNVAIAAKGSMVGIITNINFISTGSNCLVSSNPYTCKISFSYITNANSACPAPPTTRIYNAEANLSFNKNTDCTGTICHTTISSISNSGSGCVGGNTLADVTTISIDIIRDQTLKCALPTGQSCTVIPNGDCHDVQTCTTRRVCIEVPRDLSQPIYALTKANSCGVDCQNYGPYCGDGIVQTTFGEECDTKDTSGADVCQLSGQNGKRSCSATCKFADGIAAAWWPLNEASTNGLTFVDRSGTNDGICNTAASCPEFKAVGGARSGEATYHFDGNNDYFVVPHSAAIMPTSTLTVEVWIKPEQLGRAGSLYPRIFEKGGFLGSTMLGGYDLEINNNLIAFNVWGRDHNQGVLSKNAVALNTWTYIVATYEWSPTGVDTVKMYVNGILDNTATFPGSSRPYMATNIEGLFVGRAFSGEYGYFTGSMNDIKIENRVLQADEIKDRYDSAWACIVAPHGTASVAAAGSCGDGKVDPGEVCDLGLIKNGQKCSPAYGQTCQFCQANSAPDKNDGCKNTYNVRSDIFCGNGIIDGTNEGCETDQLTGDIYSRTPDSISTASVVTSPFNGYLVKKCTAEGLAAGQIGFKKGTKVCNSTCSSIVVQETGGSCALCGASGSGSVVAGTVLSAVDPTLPTPPGVAKVVLYGATTTVSGMIVLTDSKLPGQPAPTFNYQFQKADGSPNPINNDPICSSGDGLTYKLRFVGDPLFDARDVAQVTQQFLPIVVSSKPETWQYDYILSPYIDPTVRPSDIRVVVSWVGPANLVIGLARSDAPAGTPPVIEDGTLANHIVNTDTTNNKQYYQQNYSDNTSGVNSGNSKFFTWYHGLGQTPGGMSVKTFTVDTGAMTAGQYFFFVRSADTAIASLASSAHLKVEVYVPPAGLSGFYSSPVQTFNFNLATLGTSNSQARYWDAFTIKQQTTGVMSDKIQNATFFDVTTQVTTPYPNGRVVTGPGVMQ